MGVINHTEKEKEEPPPLIIHVPMSMKSEPKWEAMDAWGGLTPNQTDSLTQHTLLECRSSQVSNWTTKLKRLNKFGAAMAARAALVASRPWSLGGHGSSAHRTSISIRNSVGFVLCCADPATSSKNGSNNKKKEEHVDTRIHWGNSTDGWIGDDEPAASSGQSTSSSGNGNSSSSRSSSRTRRRNLNSNASIIDQAPDSHYRYMGISADAEIEDIKAAYRRLSKQYHPDTTSLPIEIAAQKFIQLKDAYDTLSNEELRSLYDRRLETKVASILGASFYGYESGFGQQGYDTRANKRPESPSTDTLGADENMPLSSQAQTALAFDLFVLFICICVILYVVFIKHAHT